MAHSMAAVAKRNKDELYTPLILVKPIIKHLQIWAKKFIIEYKRFPIILCPFDNDYSEFVIEFKSYIGNMQMWDIKYGHINDGQDFFEHDYGEWDICISNPPFSLKKRVFEQLFDTGKPFALIMNMMALNYEEIGRLFSDNPIQILSFDRRISYDGNPSSFMSCYICKDFLEKDLIFEKLAHNNAKKNFQRSRMTLGRYLDPPTDEIFYIRPIKMKVNWRGLSKKSRKTLQVDVEQELINAAKDELRVTKYQEFINEKYKQQSQPKITNKKKKK